MTHHHQQQQQQQFLRVYPSSYSQGPVGGAYNWTAGEGHPSSSTQLYFPYQAEGEASSKSPSNDCFDYSFYLTLSAAVSAVTILWCGLRALYFITSFWTRQFLNHVKNQDLTEHLPFAVRSVLVPACIAVAALLCNYLSKHDLHRATF